ncbi:FAD-binding oxidoreductase [Streptomyces sp. CA-249302]|uniref:FAD-binding oxidoreductase n=1 Tax=Streptomyces sp. CA-249302 TaxID=3240058 RepID=UPI003D916174
MTDVSLAPPSLPDEMVRELTAVVGADSVHIERRRVDEFKDAYWIPGDETYAASAVVQPATTDQVREIVHLAGRHGVPVWPHSQGRNLGHGGASPRVRGSIQIGFQKMNRVLEINEELAYAVVEPGVTWFDLYEAVQASGHRLMTPCPDLGWGSIIGNSMDAGHTYQQYGADYMLPTGFEVVLPDGDLLRTGAGAMPGGQAWHVYKRSLGPSLDRLFVQSNLGIVTRMGVWLKRLPEAYAPLMLSVGEDDDLEAAVDTIRELRLAGHLEGAPALFSTLRASHMLRDLPVAAPHLLDDAELREIGERTGVGAWAARAAVWGDQEVVQAKVRRIRRAWARIPSGRVESPRLYGPDEYGELTCSADQIMIGIPTLKAIESTPDHVAHIDVAPVLPLRGSEVRTMVERGRALMREAGANFGATLVVTGERSCVVILGIRYDRTDPAGARAAFGLARRLVAEAGALGYGESRPHLECMDLAADQYSFNDHAYRRFVEKIKDAVDPTGILAPGRHGIWPASYRDGAPASPCH